MVGSAGRACPQGGFREGEQKLKEVRGKRVFGQRDSKGRMAELGGMRGKEVGGEDRGFKAGLIRPCGHL